MGGTELGNKTRDNQYYMGAKDLLCTGSNQKSKDLVIGIGAANRAR